jgi:NO-binding membrane sensor protein with MHYT domain
VVAFLASFTAVELSGGLNALHRSKGRPFCLIRGAVSMGVGIWSMRFIGMLAFSLPIRIGYDVSATAASLVLAIGASFIALATVSRGACASLERSWASACRRCISPACTRCRWTR